MVDPHSTGRALRVFVSSTFRDQRLEREELLKRVFPLLRRLCEQRGAVWSEIDLRWGIPEESVLRGEVVPLCLQELRRCNVFIAILAERYGWVPGRLPPEVLEQETWLDDPALADCSDRKSVV